MDARPAGNPVVPLVRALTEAAGEEAGRWVHWGATSQDVMDSASMLVARRALEPIDADLARVAAACARLAEEHRDTPIAGRTLLQQALPTTFGLKAAGWLVGVRAARERLAAVRLYAQLGGAAGTLASLGSNKPRVAAGRRGGWGWRSRRCPGTRSGYRADLGAVLAPRRRRRGEDRLDVVLLAQTEVGR